MTKFSLASTFLTRLLGRQPHPPGLETAKAAWLKLEAISLPVAGYVRACLAKGQSLPIRHGNTDVDEWWLAVQKKAFSSVTEVIAAILTGVELKVWPALEDVMARSVQNGGPAATTRLAHLNGPVLRREVYLRDSRDRVIVPRLYELGHGGPLVLPRDDGGRISRATVERSAWVICDGWVASAPPSARVRKGNGGGGDSSSENTPPPTVVRASAAEGNQ